MNILVVDDETFHLQSLGLILRRWGHDVLEALNGEDALKLFEGRRKSKIDLIITDYAMPVINGIELVQVIRDWIEDIPAILMTAYGDKDLVIKALRRGFDGFVEKPIMIDELKEEIDRISTTEQHSFEFHKPSDPIPELIHKINNPLISIMSSAELGLLNISIPESMEKCLNHILSAAKSIRKTCEELMVLGKARSAKVERIDVTEVLNHCLDMLTDLILLKEIQVVRSSEGEELFFWGERDGFEQMIFNLLVNAIEAMENAPERHLSADAEIIGQSIMIRIEDTGCGIPQEVMGKIFEPHFTRKKHGNGIGLSVVRDVVDRHRGKIEVESQPGIETAIRVIFPVHND